MMSLRRVLHKEVCFSILPDGIRPCKQVLAVPSNAASGAAATCANPQCNAPHGCVLSYPFKSVFPEQRDILILQAHCQKIVLLGR